MAQDELQFLKVLNDAVAAGLLANDRAVVTLYALAARPNDERLLRSVQYQTAMANLVGPLRRTLFVTPHRMRGDFTLGKHPGGPALIDFEEILGNLLLLGGSGAGKTVTYYYLLPQALFRPDVGTWIFDMAKREFRHLLPVATLARRELYLLRWRFFPFNPLEVPRGVHPTEWANAIADNFTSTLGVPPVARNHLRVALTKLYRRNGVYEGSRNWPTLRELADEIRVMKGNEAAKQAILDRLDTLLAVAGEMLDHRQGLSLESLERYAVVFELDGLGLIYQCFLAACMLSATFSRRVATRDSKRILVVSLDEGQQLYSQRAQASAEGPSYISLMTSQVRAMRIILIVGVQTVHDLSRSLLSNTATKILGRCGDADDYAVLSRSMGLTTEQQAWLPLHLAPGLFVAKLSYGDNQHPFLLRVPYIGLPQTVSDAEVEASGHRLLSALNWRPEPPVTVSSPADPATVAASPVSARMALTPDEQRLYDDVVRKPFLPFSKRAARLGISARKAILLRRGLCEKGHAQEWGIDAVRGGQKIVLLVPLGTSSDSESRDGDRKGRGKPQHRFAIRCIEASLAFDCWEGELEVARPAGTETTFVDLLMRRGNEELFIEFEQRPDYAQTNIRKALAAGAQKILVVTPTRKVEEEIRRVFEKSATAAETIRVGFSLLSAFLEEGSVVFRPPNGLGGKAENREIKGGGDMT